jgi:hypothetical protein
VIEGAGGAIGAQDQLEARGEVEVESAQRNGVEVGDGRFDKALHGLFRGAGGDQGSSLRRVQQALGAQVVSVGVAGALAGEHADAAAGAGALGGGLDDLLVDAERGGGDGLEVKVGIVSAGGEGLAQAAFQQALSDAELLKEITFVAGVGSRSGRGHRVSSLRRLSNWGYARAAGTLPEWERTLPQ